MTEELNIWAPAREKAAALRREIDGLSEERDQLVSEVARLRDECVELTNLAGELRERLAAAERALRPAPGRP